jgi:LAO/AO transport system kinase
MDFEVLRSGPPAARAAAVARAISQVENQRPGFEQLLAAAHRYVGGARRVGITGPPGAGKSTLTQELVRHWRGQGESVAVIAVDPTSPFSGGALLGDRIRMEGVSLDREVFIRSMATRGSLGGLAASTREVCDLLDAAGFARILIETVGVGQSELAVTGMADSTALVLVPESGDGIQALKSGLMELADVYVVNKADRPGAQNLAREIEITQGIRRGEAFRGIRAHHGRALGQSGREGGAEWQAPVILTTATSGAGIPDVAAALDRHLDWMTASGELVTRRRNRFAVRTREVLDRMVQHWLREETRAEELLRDRLDEVVSGRLSPYELAAEILAVVKDGARV